MSLLLNGSCPITPPDLHKLWTQLTQRDYPRLAPRVRLQQPLHVPPPGDDLAALCRARVVAADAQLRQAAPPTTLDVEQEGVIATLFGVSDYRAAPVRAAIMETLLHLWTCHSGARFALDAAVETLRWRREDSGGRTANFSVYHALHHTPQGLVSRAETSAAIPGAWRYVRRWLGTLDAPTFAELRAYADTLRADAPDFRCAAFAYAFAEPTWAREVLERAITDRTWPVHMPLVLLALEPDDLPRALLALEAADPYLSPRNFPLSELPTLLDASRHAAPALIHALWDLSLLRPARRTPKNARQATVEAAVAAAIARVETPEAAAWLAARVSSPPALQAVESFAARAPHLLLPHLLERAAATGEASLLQSLLTRHAAALEGWSAAWTPTQRALLHAREPAGEGAPSPRLDELPAWLLKPPKAWKPRPSTFWSPSTLPAITLQSGAALAGEALEPLRLLLGHLDSPEAPAALQSLKNLATPESLDAFGQAIITAWIEAGGIPRERWAFQAASLLLDPSPSTQAEVNQTWFKDKTWYIYGRLKTWTSKQLAPLLQARGARILSTVSSKLDVLVTEGPTPELAQELGGAVQRAVTVGAKVIGEHDLLRLLRGRLPASPEPERASPSDGLAALRALIYQTTPFDPARWHAITEAVDSLQGDAQRAAIDYVSAWLDTLPPAERCVADLEPWFAPTLSGDDHPRLQLVRKASFGFQLTGQAARRLFAITHLSRLHTLSLRESPLSRAAWVALAAAPHLRGLRSLHLYGVKLDLRAAAALAAPAFNATLEDLILEQVAFEPNALQTLLAPDAWPALSHLNTFGLKLKDANPHRVLADAAHLNLHTLCLTSPAPTDPPADWSDLLNAPHLHHLTTLKLAGLAAGPHLAALAASSLLPHLHHLHLKVHNPTPQHLAPDLLRLLASPRLANLRTLEVHFPDAASFDAIFLNPALISLTRLVLCGYYSTQITDLSSLLRADLPNLRHLTLESAFPRNTLTRLLLSDRLPALTHLDLSQSGLTEAELNPLFDLHRPALQRVTGIQAVPTARPLLLKLAEHLKITLQPHHSTA